ncbi:hypothetical protein GBR81_21880, partial [Escherichia coli]|nr:hypothetical protein [Escherichia coli]
FSPVSYRAHGLPVSENLLEQDFYASGPNQKWAGVWKYRGKSKQQLTIAIIISIIFFVLIYHLIL